MTCKFLLSSISIFIIFFCNCQTQGGYNILKNPYSDILNRGYNILKNPYSDILNRGYNILKNRENKHHLRYQINSLWREIMEAHLLRGLIKTNSSNLMLLLGIYGSSALNTLNRFSIGSRRLSVDAHTLKTQLQSDIDDAHKNPEKPINKIYGYLCDIDLEYENVFSPNRSKAIPKTFVATDSLYRDIHESCDNPSTCFFRQITRNHSLPRNGTGLISIGYSSSGEIYFAYLIIAFNLLKGYAAEIYQYDGSNMTKKVIESISKKFVRHALILSASALHAIRNAQRAIKLDWLSADDTTASYIQLEWFVSQVLVNEANLRTKDSWRYNCDDYEGPHKFHNHSGVPSHGRDVCRGTMSHCHVEEQPRFCPAEKYSTRRYGGTFGSGAPYPSTCRKHNFDLEIRSFYGDIRCDVCTCVCDDHDDPETIRTFSLREVTSNIRQNRVITGMRLRKINRTIYIQIQEGELNHNSEVKSRNWVPVNTLDETASSEDSFRLSYPSQSFVNLDTISTQDEFVRQHIRNYTRNHRPFFTDPYLLTGVKFGSHYGRLNFGIRLTAWNSTTRKLSLETWNNWIFNEDDTTRKRINLEHPDIPTKTVENVEVEGYSYIQFQPSDNDKDFGQTTVPFLDARDIVTHLPIPLSGAGLYYKGKPGYGGFIGLKLISSDFSRFIVTELRN